MNSVFFMFLEYMIDSVGDKYVSRGSVSVAIERRPSMPFYVFQIFTEKDGGTQILVNENVWQNIFNIASPKEGYANFRDTKNVAWSLKFSSPDDCKKLMLVFGVCVYNIVFIFFLNF
jgi:hypothetical protein